ncbi:MAG: hypothetical protein WC254_06225 [Candidatus Woesearchaeota archaeon]|jgi:hypothetical protein
MEGLEEKIDNLTEDCERLRLTRHRSRLLSLATIGLGVFLGYKALTATPKPNEVYELLALSSLAVSGLTFRKEYYSNNKIEDNITMAYDCVDSCLEQPPVDPHELGKLLASARFMSDLHSNRNKIQKEREKGYAVKVRTLYDQARKSPTTYDEACVFGSLYTSFSHSQGI